MNTFKRKWYLAVLAVFLAMGLFVEAQAACCTPLAAQPVANLVISRAQYTDAVVLTASAAQTQAVPVGANYVVFSATCNFYAQLTSVSAATVPAVTTTDGSASTLNPTAWSLKGGGSGISLIAPTACVVTLSFYQ